MPIYEYKCSECNTKFECLQKITDPPLEKTPECSGECKLEKILSTFEMSFVGTGFYKTDYK